MNVSRKQLGGLGLLVISLLIADRLVKWWALREIAPLGSTGYDPIPDLLRFVFVRNRGVAFGFFQNYSTLFAVLAIVVIVGIIWRSWGWFGRTDLLARTSVALIIAGGIGNLIDRFLYGFVVDMVHIIPLPFFQVFNVADVAISLGGVLLFISLWREDARNRRVAATASEVGRAEP